MIRHAALRTLYHRGRPPAAWISTLRASGACSWATQAAARFAVPILLVPESRPLWLASAVAGALAAASLQPLVSTVAAEDGDPPAPGKKGKLCFGHPSADDADVAKCSELLARTRAGGGLHAVASELATCGDPSVRLPLVILSDFEVDDIMAIAQLWEFHREHAGTDPNGRPLVCFVVNFEKKDGGNIFEKKLVMANLALGIENFPTLAHGKENQEYWVDKTRHSCTGIVHNTQRTYADIAAYIADVVPHHPRFDLVLLSPMHGHLSGIVNKLEESNPGAFAQFQSKVQVTMYTGSFNVRGTFRDDFDALRRLCQPAVASAQEKSCGAKPFVDISRYPFFGGGDADSSTKDLNAFVSPSLCRQIAEISPLLNAAMRTFTDEFVGTMVTPIHDGLWDKKKPRPTPEMLRRFQREIAPHFGGVGADGVEAYAQHFLAHRDLLENVDPFRQMLLEAFAEGTRSAPLCDQLCFLNQWLEMNETDTVRRDFAEWYTTPGGMSGVGDLTVLGGGRVGQGVLGTQPVLVSHLDTAALDRYSKVMEEYFLRHISRVQSPKLKQQLVQTRSS